MLNTQQRIEIAIHAKRINAPEPHLSAVVQVESDGVYSAGLVDARKPVIRWEGHYFDQRLVGKARVEARKLGLSDPKSGGIKNSASQAKRYDLLQAAIDLCKRYKLSPALAYESASWGVGQVMGAHWKMLGYASAEAFIAVVCSGLAGQVQVMADFIVKDSLDDELRDGRWASFARGYNGPGYAKNKYDTKMAAAAKALGGIALGVDGFLRMGSTGAKVREVQALLVRLGYVVKTDGDFGPSTKKALAAFQASAGLKADGIFGPETERLLSTYKVDPAERPGELKVADVGAVKRGVGGGLSTGALIIGAKEVLRDGIEQLAGVADGSPWLMHVQGGLTIAATVVALAGLGYAAWGYLHSKKTVEV